MVSRDIKKYKMTNTTNEYKIFICACNSFEHQAIFWKDDNLYIYIHLRTYRNFFKRLIYGIRYIFGYKSRFGSWDEFIFNEDSEKQLYYYLKSKIDDEYHQKK